MTLEATQRLLAIMRQLRDPDHGCPWDRRQDFASIVPHTLEEAFELAEAIENGDAEAIRAELGDLLFQVVFYAQLGSERDWFDFDSVAAAIAAKLERRHPHVFAETAPAEAELSGQWERIKAEERRESGRKDGVLADVPRALPALSRARKLQKRAAHVGFDWGDPAPVFAKIEEELDEFRSELARGADNHARMEEEFGDFLFACVNLARHAGIDPETALRRANRKFETRFAFIEAQLAARGCSPEDSSLEEMDALWEEAKANGG